MRAAGPGGPDRALLRSFCGQDVHMVRYHGFFASHARGRARSLRVAQAGPPESRSPETPEPAEPSDPDASVPLRPRRLPWAELLRRVDGVEVRVCTECRSPVRVLAFITDPKVTSAILVSWVYPPPPRPWLQPVHRVRGSSHSSTAEAKNASLEIQGAVAVLEDRPDPRPVALLALAPQEVGCVFDDWRPPAPRGRSAARACLARPPRTRWHGGARPTLCSGEMNSPAHVRLRHCRRYRSRLDVEAAGGLRSRTCFGGAWQGADGGCDQARLV